MSLNGLFEVQWVVAQPRIGICTYMAFFAASRAGWCRKCIQHSARAVDVNSILPCHASTKSSDATFIQLQAQLSLVVQPNVECCTHRLTQGIQARLCRCTRLLPQKKPDMPIKLQQSPKLPCACAYACACVWACVRACACACACAPA
jgi:hypothetical protein